MSLFIVSVLYLRAPWFLRCAEKGVGKNTQCSEVLKPWSVPRAVDAQMLPAETREEDSNDPWLLRWPKKGSLEKVTHNEVLTKETSEETPSPGIAEMCEQFQRLYADKVSKMTMMATKLTMYDARAMPRLSCQGVHWMWFSKSNLIERFRNADLTAYRKGSGIAAKFDQIDEQECWALSETGDGVLKKPELQNWCGEWFAISYIQLNARHVLGFNCRVPEVEAPWFEWWCGLWAKLWQEDLEEHRFMRIGVRSPSLP